MLETCEELGNKLGISKALYYMGNVYYSQGDFEAAIAYYEKMLKICMVVSELQQSPDTHTIFPDANTCHVY
jgi:TolA-binding protein